MIVRSHRVSKGVCLKALAGIGVTACLMVSPVRAQNPFVTAPPEAMDNVSGIAAPSAGAVNRARGTVKEATGAAAGTGAAARDLMTSKLGQGARKPGAVGEASRAVSRVVVPRVKAIMGTRVFDAVTDELLDDAQLQNIDQAEVQNLGLVDDGTKGDRLPDDGEFAKVDESREFIGQANQRLKERLIQAIYSAEQLNPLEFYGFNIMTTERSTPAPRNRRWELVASPNGGPGKTLAEVATDKPLQVPKYREWEQERDRKIAGKDGWAVRFLDEYRLDKGNITSEFYQIYIPLPPVPPGVPPPPGWTPFPNPSGVPEQTGGNAQTFSNQGFKIKNSSSGEPLPPTGGSGAQPYFDKGMSSKMFR